MNDNWRPGGIVHWIWNWTWQPSEALVALVPLVLIEDCPLLWMVVRSQTYYPEHILLMGAGRLVTLLSRVLALFGLAFRGGY